MKTANKIISILTLFLIMIVSSCDMLQSTLSSEMNKELTAQTGSGSLVEKTFYYNGSKAADLLTTGDFKIDFGKKVVISKDGLVGKFLVTYTDGDSNISTVELKLGSNNELSLDCTELYLDMKPVLEYLKEKNVNNATVEISVSGLVCNEGEQKGRNVSAFKETIKVQPLFKKLSDISVSTKNAPAGFTFEIPLNGKVVLENGAYVDCADYDLELVGLGADGKSIIIKTNEDLTDKFSKSIITIIGNLSVSCGNTFDTDFEIYFNPSDFPITKKITFNGNYQEVIPKEEFSLIKDGIKEITVEVANVKGEGSPWWANVSYQTDWSNQIELANGNYWKSEIGGWSVTFNTASDIANYTSNGVNVAGLSNLTADITVSVVFN